MDTVPLWVFIIVLLLNIALNAYLSFTDYSVSQFSEAKIRKFAEDGEKRAIDLINVSNLELKLHSAITFPTLLSNVFCAAFTVLPLTKAITDSLSTLSSMWEVLYVKILVAIVLVLIIFLITYIFGVIIPQNIAAAKNSIMLEKAALNTVFVFYTLFKPILFLFAKASSSSEVPTQADADIIEDEILMMVDEGEENGTIESTEKELIENVFNFRETTASEVMTHRTNVIALWINDTEEEIFKTITETGKSRFPVYSDDIDHIVGILMVRDYFLNNYSDSPKPFKDLLRAPYLIPETVHTNDLFRDMQKNKTHIAIVVDEYGGTAGIVTLEDLLEELVGNIYDEFDTPAEQKDDIVKLSDNVWRVAGNVDLKTLEDALEADIFTDDEEYETVGGLVLSQFTTIPADGTNPEVMVNGLYIYVEELENRRIISTKISQIMTVELPEDQQNEDN